ncbi:hypothetical protein [Niabella hirudinis]
MRTQTITKPSPPVHQYNSDANTANNTNARPAAFPVFGLLPPADITRKG